MHTINLEANYLSYPGIGPKPCQ